MFGNKYEEASELLEKACNNYKLAKMWREAADAFALLADCHLKCDSKHEAAQAHVEAANANKKVDPAAAIASLRVAISHFTDMGRLSIAAKHLKDIAEQYEKDEKEDDACEVRRRRRRRRVLPSADQSRDDTSSQHPHAIDTSSPDYLISTHAPH